MEAKLAFLGHAMMENRAGLIVNAVDPGGWDGAKVSRNRLREMNGMISFKQELSPADSDQIRAYVIHRATEDKKAEAATAKSH